MDDYRTELSAMSQIERDPVHASIRTTTVYSWYYSRLTTTANIKHLIYFLGS